MDKISAAEQKSKAVRKHVGAIHTSGELSLLERKLSNILLLQAYDNLLTTRTHQLNVSTLSLMLGWETGKNVDRLRGALKSLVSMVIEFNVMNDAGAPWSVSSIISFAEIKNGVCTYRYDESMAEGLSDPSIYAMVNVGIQQKFTTSYALSLYENCLRYVRVGSTGWIDLPIFRKLLGATQDYYDDFRRLNSKVIQKAVQQINEVDDIQITPEFRKTGRLISAVRISVKQGRQQSLLVSSDDNFGEIKETELFRKLRSHGISEKL